MQRKLPKMYKSEINKKIDNVQQVYSSLEKNESKNLKLKKDNNIDRFTIEQKIYNIFNSPDYIYKADVTIVTDKETIRKRIIGKVKDELLTMDNERININTIKDIYK